MSTATAPDPVEAGALTNADLVARWRLEGEGRALVVKLQRMRETLNLRPFYGKGSSARYRLADVIRAEERAATRPR